MSKANKITLLILNMVLFAMLTSCSNQKDVKCFNDLKIASNYAEQYNRKTLLLFTRLDLSNRTFETLLLVDDQVRKALESNQTDVLILNYDDRRADYKSICFEKLSTNQVPVCGVLDKNSNLISELCFIKGSDKDTKTHLLKVINQSQLSLRLK